MKKPRLDEVSPLSEETPMDTTPASEPVELTQRQVAVSVHQHASQLMLHPSLLESSPLLRAPFSRPHIIQLKIYPSDGAPIVINLYDSDPNVIRQLLLPLNPDLVMSLVDATIVSLENLLKSNAGFGTTRQNHQNHNIVTELQISLDTSEKVTRARELLQQLNEIKSDLAKEKPAVLRSRLP